MKVLEGMGFKRGKGKRGFTLIELLIVMVILAILAGVVVMAVGNVFGQAKEQAYNTIKPQIQNAVIAFMVATAGDRPAVASGANYSVVGQTLPCDVIDICDIIGSGELLRNVPDGVLGGIGGDDTGNNFEDGGCTNPLEDGGSYVWLMDVAGNVYSVCDENGDGAINQANASEATDGFSGSQYLLEEIWP